MNDGENQEIQSYSYSRSEAKAEFTRKLNHYWDLLLRRWWVLALGAIVGVAIAVMLAQSQKASFTSVGRMMVSNKLAIPEGSVYTEDANSFVGTQAALMQSDVVSNRAYVRVVAQSTDLVAQDTNLVRPSFSLKVSVSPKTSIFVLQGTGPHPAMVQRYVQACMEEYIGLRKEMRAQTSDRTVGDISEEVISLEKELRQAEEALVQFQSTNSMVWLEQQGNTVGGYIASLTQRLANMRSEYDLLQTLTLDQNLQRQQETTTTLATDSSDMSLSNNPALSNDTLASDYLRAKQQVILMKAEMEDLGQFLKPKHPKMIAMSEEIARRERLLDIFRKQSVEQLENHKASLALEIQNLEKDLKQWNAKILDISRDTAEFQRLKNNAQRIQTLYERLLATVQTLGVNRNIDQDSVMILEKAGTAQSSKRLQSIKVLAAAIFCMGLSVAFLLVLDHMDDRVNSFSELQEIFDEPVLAQIPREKKPGKAGQVGLLEKDDERHAFLEAYRNLRSSLLYMSEGGKKPKALLLTSSIPNEGKSMTSANLAITMASTNAKVLLVDADLRKGVLHRRFGIEADKGLCEVLTEGLNWEPLVLPTRYPNLFLLPRGGTTNESSELFIGEDAQKFIEAAEAKYDVVILDTAPVMAADDVTSLAPHMDNVLFVLRAEHTSARVARTALNLLKQRNVEVMGIVFNAVRPNSADYYYYYKYKDYYASYPSGGGKAKSRRRHSSKHTSETEKAES